MAFGLLVGSQNAIAIKEGDWKMDTLSAFARVENNKNSRIRVFDWDKAAKLIKKANPQVASAGLGLDWEWTGGEIYKNGEPIMDSYTYLASNWATPELDMDGDIQPCWKYQSDTPSWDSNTKWPKSALKILKE